MLTAKAFSPDSRRAYLSGSDQTVAIYDATRWECVGSLHGHRDELWCVDVSREGRWLASGSRDETIRIWSTSDTERAPDHWPPPEDAQEVYLAGDGQTLATISTNARVHLWRTYSGVPGRSGLLRISPRQGWLAVRLDDGYSWGLQVGLWQWSSPDRARVLTKHKHRVLDMAFSPSSRTAIASSP